VPEEFAGLTCTIIIKAKSWISKFASPWCLDMKQLDQFYVSSPNQDLLMLQYVSTGRSGKKCNAARGEIG
jgi:hypothetical protein